MYTFLNFYKVLEPLQAHAQTWSQSTTAALVATSESNLSAGFSNNLAVVIPITIGIALVMFFLGWVLSRISGRH